MTSCIDWQRHEFFCTHYGDGSSPQVAWTTADGCSGRVCEECWKQIKHWPDITESIAGRNYGLDFLEAARIINQQENEPDA